VTAVVLVVLPFVSTFDDLLTVIGMRLGIARRCSGSCRRKSASRW